MSFFLVPSAAIALNIGGAALAAVDHGVAQLVAPPFYFIACAAMALDLRAGADPEFKWGRAAVLAIALAASLLVVSGLHACDAVLVVVGGCLGWLAAMLSVIVVVDRVERGENSTARSHRAVFLPVAMVALIVAETLVSQRVGDAAQWAFFVAFAALSADLISNRGGRQRIDVAAAATLTIVAIGLAPPLSACAGWVAWAICVTIGYERLGMDDEGEAGDEVKDDGVKNEEAVDTSVAGVLAACCLPLAIASSNIGDAVALFGAVAHNELVALIFFAIAIFLYAADALLGRSLKQAAVTGLMAIGAAVYGLGDDDLATSISATIRAGCVVAAIARMADP